MIDVLIIGPEKRSGQYSGTGMSATRSFQGNDVATERISRERLSASVAPRPTAPALDTSTPRNCRCSEPARRVDDHFLYQDNI